jgi:hypothetical protein
VVALRETDLRQALGYPSTLEPSWIELELDTFSAGPPALHYLNLFAAPIERGLQRASWVIPPLNRELADKTSMDDLPDATEEELTTLLDGLETPAAAAVYDVGQGGCNAALSSGTPSLYFDFGGGVLANRNTFPMPLTTFCFRRQPPIILSTGTGITGRPQTATPRRTHRPGSSPDSARPASARSIEPCSAAFFKTAQSSSGPTLSCRSSAESSKS